MPVSIPPGFAQIVVPFLDAATSEENIVTFGVDLSLYEGSNLDMVEDVDTTFRTALRTHIDDTLELQPVRAQVGNDGPPIVVVSPINNQFGGRSGTKASPQVAVIFTKRTAFGGRQFRGRMYMPGLLLQTDVTEGGRIGTSRHTAIAAQADVLVASLISGSAFIRGSGGTPMVLLHSQPASGSAPPAPTIVTSIQVQTLVGTQRGRLPR